MSLAWGGVSNGAIPHDRLTAIPNFRPLSAPSSAAAGSNLLRSDAARQVSGLMAAFYERFGRVLYVREAYRPIANQQFWKTYWTNRGRPGNAAAPGTSNHGWALSCDFGVGDANRDFTAEEKAWMDANAPAYGFVNDVAWEVWHFTYIAAPSRVVGSMISNPQTGKSDAQLAAEAAAAAEAKRKAEEAKRRAEEARLLRLRKATPAMWIRSSKSGVWYLIEGHDVREIHNVKDAQRVSRVLGYKSTRVSSDDAKYAINIARARAKELGDVVGLPAIEKALDQILAAEEATNASVEALAADD